MLITDSIDRFCDDKRLFGLAESSVEQYSFQLHALAKWLDVLGVNDAAQITLELVRRYLCGARPRLKQWSMCGKRSIIKLWLDWMHDTGIAYVDSGALPKIHPPRADEIRRVTIDDANASRLIDYAKKQYRQSRSVKALQDMVLIGLLFGVGLRISEAAAMQVEHINIISREIIIPQSKGNTPRYVAIPPSVIGVLRFFLQLAKLDPKSSLLTHDGGKHYTSTSLARRMQRIGKRAGVMLTSHTGRRFCITRLAYVNLLMAKKQAGHKRLETTMLYIEESRDELRRTVRYHDPLRQAMSRD